MKLLSCYIENFGKLHQFQLHFDPNLTILKEENGFGKTTLVVFIKTMFYGFPKATKSLDKNERKKYTPWQGGIFGGYLEFEHHNIRYRIERTFGQTSKQDRFNLFRLSPFGRCNDFSDNIGYELFGIGPESFEKTIYLSQRHLSTELSTIELNGALASVTESVSDIGCYEKAIQKLKLQRSKIIPYRGKDGALKSINSNISELEYRIKITEEKNTALQHFNQDIINLKKKLQEKQNEYDEIQALKAQEIHSNEFISNHSDQLDGKIRQLKTELHNLKLKYPYGFPHNDELQKAYSLLQQSKHVPTQPLSRCETHELQNLNSFFHNGIPEDESISESERISDRVNKLQAESLSLKNPPEKKFRHFILILITILSCCFSAGLFLLQGEVYTEYAKLFPVSYICSSLFLMLSFIQVIFNVTACFKRKNRMIQIEKTIMILEEEITAFIDPFGLAEYSFHDAIYLIKKNKKRYLQLLEMSRTDDSTQKNINHAIHVILGKYHLSNFTYTEETLNQVNSDKLKLRELIAQIEILKSQKDEINNKTAHFQPDFNEACSNHEQEILEELKVLQETLLSYHKKIVLLQNDLECLNEYKDQLSDYLEEREKLLYQVKLIDKAIEHIESAYHSLSVRFVLPIKERLNFYMLRFFNVTSEQIFIDKNMNISFENAGIQRELPYFSKGELELVSFCMRLALIDVLYPNESHLLILDDPFTNLDEINMRKALELLNSISTSHQILYLTCHESRI